MYIYLLKVDFEEHKPTKKEAFMSSSHTWTKSLLLLPVAISFQKLLSSVKTHHKLAVPSISHKPTPLKVS